jgi:anti-sigma regulatory factor (Ser/Thr protein kinase)
MTTQPAPTVAGNGYRHEALFYGTTDEFVDQTLAFVRDALAADEPVLVVLAAAKNAQLAAALGVDRDRVEFADMDAIGANPARIIPAWHDFLDRRAGRGRRVRGIGEPISARRTGAELEECHRHEALLNVAFRDPEFWLLCPYDTATLDAEVLDDARRHHPYVRDGGKPAVSVAYPGPAAFWRPSCAALSTTPAHAARFDFDGRGLGRVRERVRALADAGRLTPERRADLVLAVHEVAANSIRHGGAAGSLLTWLDVDRVVCEVRDRGYIDDPLADRRPAPSDAVRGRGLWMANQLCDLVQVRTSAAGTTVRLHQRTP